ncbi:hypothetical protein PF006_g22715, partial [Phytophthora fragariae]
TKDSNDAAISDVASADIVHSLDATQESGGRMLHKVKENEEERAFMNHLKYLRTSIGKRLPWTHSHKIYQSAKNAKRNTEAMRRWNSSLYHGFTRHQCSVFTLCIHAASHGFNHNSSEVNSVHHFEIGRRDEDHDRKATLGTFGVVVVGEAGGDQRGQTPLFGQWEEVSGAKLAAWAAVLFYCGVSGLVALVLKNERAAKQALGCWVLLLVLHTCYLNVAVSKSVWPTGAAPHERPHSWSTGKMMVQVLTDAMSSGFLVWLVRQRNANQDKVDFLQQPLLPIRGITDVHDQLRAS